MINFQNLFVLDKHHQFLSKKLKNEHVFLVGGCVRDLLLGTNLDPKDIDLAMAGDPKKIYNGLDKTNISHFITEKFGTMTIIPKKQDKDKEILQYELTPFRQETTYSDNRHPDEIVWSDSLVEDAKRREFTISCMYYFSDTKDIKLKKKLADIDHDLVKKHLDAHGFDYLADLGLWIVQDQEWLEKLFKNGKFQKASYDELIESYANIHDTNKPSNQTWKFLIDPFKGIHDMIDGKLRCVGEPDRRFGEDALRLIRALRFVNVINQKLSETESNTDKHYIDFEKETRKSIQKNFALIQNMAKERIKIELDKVFRKGNPFGFVALLDEVNMLKILFPSVYATKYVDQPVRYHPFDVYHHTMMTLYHGQRISSNPLVRWALLFHDVGKVDQYYLYNLGLSREEIQQAHYLNHRNTSSKIAEKELRALGFANKEIDEIGRYIDHHHKPEEILNAKPENREKKLRKLLSEAGIERMRNMFDVVLGDRLGHYNPVQPPETDEIYMLKDMTEKLYKEEGQFTMKELKVSGDKIMKHFKLDPGPKVGEYLKSAFEWVMNDIENRNNVKQIIHFLEGQEKRD